MKKQYIIIFVLVLALGYALRSVTQDNQVVQLEPEAETAEIATKQQVIDLINKLIKENASFAVKLAHPLLPGKVRLWQQRGLIQFPTRQVPWVTFIKDVHEFGTNLHELLSRDPQTGDYYHVPKIQINALLYNNLQKIDQALSAHESKIEAAATSPFKLSKESLEALQKLINTYGTTFYQNKLITQISQLLKQFEPEAKKIRAQEEKAAERAGRKKVEDFVMPDFDSSDYDIGIGEDFTLPSYDTSPDFDVDLDTSDDFIKSFFE
jgi:hypothetical protein